MGQWVKLRRSDVPYYVAGEDVPPGATPIPAPDGAEDNVRGTATPADLLDGNIEQVVNRVSEADLDTIERLLEEEQAGAARKGLLDQLARMRDNLTDQEEG